MFDCPKLDSLNRIPGILDLLSTSAEFEYRMKDILAQVAHRPWPLPPGPWIMAQTWHDLLFAHWPVAIEHLRPLIPAALSIDTFEGCAWLGVVPFRMSGVRPRALPPLPWFSAFPELNVRTYVTRNGKPGVWFFSLDAANPVAVAAARALFHLPYFNAEMNCLREGDAIAYRSLRKHSAGTAVLRACYRPVGPAFHPIPGTLEFFLTERYCLYAETSRGQILRCEIHHPPWPLQTAEAEFTENTMSQADGIPRPSGSPLLHFSRCQEVVVWRPVSVFAGSRR